MFSEAAGVPLAVEPGILPGGFRLDSPQRGALTEFFRLCESAS